MGRVVKQVKRRWWWCGKHAHGNTITNGGMRERRWTTKTKEPISDTTRVRTRVKQICNLTCALRTRAFFVRTTSLWSCMLHVERHATRTRRAFFVGRHATRAFTSGMPHKNQLHLPGAYGDGTEEWRKETDLIETAPLDAR